MFQDEVLFEKVGATFRESFLLQMSWGNLEVIQSRSLAIVTVADLLVERRYHTSG